MMYFLKALLKWFNKSPAIDHRGDQAAFVIQGGDIARFIFNKRDLNASNRPRPGAFAPEFYLGRFETSVSGLNGVTQDRLWELGRTVRAKEGKSALASLQLSVRQVCVIGLHCEAAPMLGYAEHGVIVGWGADVDRKDIRLAAQIELAAAVSQAGVVHPPVPTP